MSLPRSLSSRPELSANKMPRALAPFDSVAGRFALTAVVLVLLSAARPVLAATMVLTGGDATDGLNLNNGTSVVVAETVNGASGISIQGVTFNAAPAGSVQLGTGVFPVNNLSGNGMGGVDGTNTFSGPHTTNDTNLLSLINTGVAYGSGDPMAPSENFIHVEITGLTPNGLYTVDSLVSALGYGNHGDQALNSGRQMTVTYTGATTYTDNPIILNGNGMAGDTLYNGIYDDRGTVLADSSGDITLNYVGIPNGSLPTPMGYTGDGNDGAILEAVIVTAVPEPSAAVAWAGLGAIGAALVSWRRRRQG